MDSTTPFTRSTFTTSRLLEFFTDTELTMQIGFSRSLWPLALLKELIDNSLDACETAGIAPAITVTMRVDALVIKDNGPGLPAATLERSLDYLVRVSDKAHYIAPTRGQLGNALKCLWAASFVASGQHGCIKVATAGSTHTIEVTLDRIAQQPRLTHSSEEDGLVKKGTRITLHWPGIASLLLQPVGPGFYNAFDLCRRYAIFNPHASFTYQQEGQELSHFAAPVPHWRKWLPSAPTSPHWYTPERLRNLIAAYLSEKQSGKPPQTVREFVAEFDGLKGTAKQKAVTAAAGLSGASLQDLVHNHALALTPIATLLSAMQQESRPVNPTTLGLLGEAHLTSCLAQYYGVEQESLKYRKYCGTVDGMPYALEVAFGWYGEQSQDRSREKVIGLNWTPAVKDPFVGLSSLLGDARCDQGDPVAVIVHLASPLLHFTDRGKAALSLPPTLERALAEAVTAVTRHWTRLKKHADRAQRVSQHHLEHYLKQQQRQLPTVKEAAFQVMREAYLKASAGGTLPANARQIMYAARPLVLALTGGKIWKDSAYFTQHLLPDFVEAHPAVTEKWDVVFDARGHLEEPHTGKRVDLGTVEVRGYVQAWGSEGTEELPTFDLPSAYPTAGPLNRYQAVLFVEKEGFNSLLKAAGIAEKYDLALMSTKGMSVTAARQLVARLSAQGVTILVLHDFDKSGFSILHTLRTSTRRHTYDVTPRVIDLGLRLGDVQAMQLLSEGVSYGSEMDPRRNLQASGATAEECNFLVRASRNGWGGERVELNAMDSHQLLNWLEGKLQHYIHKLIPAPETLAKAYRRATRHVIVQREIHKVLTTLPDDEAIVVPAQLAAHVRKTLATERTLSWDEAVWRVAKREARSANGG